VRVLLTGASGFVGSHVARLLQSQGCTVYALVRPTSDLWRIQDVIPALEIVRGDLTLREEMKAQLKSIQPDLCIHLAWFEAIGGYLCSPGNIDALVIGLDLVRELVAVGCRRILIAGTCVEYDTTLGYLAETSPTKAESLYAATKHALHMVADQFVRGIDAELIWLRFFSLYGPFEDERRFVPSIILPLLRNDVAKVSPGAQVRDYLYVEDAAAAVCALAMSRFTGTINVASGRPISVGDIAMKIGTILNKRELVSLGARPYRESEPMFVCANIDRIRDVTGWSPRFDLDAGLRQTIEWWKMRKDAWASVYKETKATPAGNHG